VIGNDGDGGKEMVRSSGGRSFQKTWCSDGYGSVGEHEMRRGSRKGETGEEFVKVRWLGRLEGFVG